MVTETVVAAREGYFFISSWQIVPFPTPDGPETTKTFPFFILLRLLQILYLLADLFDLALQKDDRLGNRGVVCLAADGVCLSIEFLR